MDDGADDGACGERRRNRDVDPNASGRLGVIVVLLEKRQYEKTVQGWHFFENETLVLSTSFLVYRTCLCP